MVLMPKSGYLQESINLVKSIPIHIDLHIIKHNKGSTWFLSRAFIKSFSFRWIKAPPSQHALSGQKRCRLSLVGPWKLTVS
jgi:hypothetical protein